MSTDSLHNHLDELRTAFGDKLKENAALAGYTTAKVGGPADILLEIENAEELEETVQLLWNLDIPFTILGRGSNLLISDEGLRGAALINRANAYRFDTESDPPTVWAESGANLGTVARMAAVNGLGGLEWASVIPGSVGGAVYGNAGAHGSDMKSNLLLANILHRTYGRETWTCEQMEYDYRTSALKRSPENAVILSAKLRLTHSTREAVQKRMSEFSEHRRQTQPPGASMGSMFKNPSGDYAGRLIEAAGLKGTRIGDAQISSVHANFFVNLGNAKAADIWQLIQLTQRTVLEKFDVQLQLEIEPLGHWPENA